MFAIKDRILLLTGILLIVSSFFLRGLSDTVLYFWLVLSSGIVIKSIFLYRSVKAGRLHWNFSLKLLLTGVSLVLLSIVFRGLNHEWFFPDVLLYSGILMKLLFVAIVAIKKVKSKKR